jgi:beta-N-acetylhexosaminidase
MTSLREKLAQLICVEVRGNELNTKPEKYNEIKDSLIKNQWGSIIIFDSSVEQSSSLIDDFQASSKIPLFVCCDLERGAGQHFKGGTHLPYNMAIGATRNLDYAYKSGKITAQEAKDIGVNVIFAPDADVNSNPNNPIINIRAYSEDPVLVADMAQAFIKGCQAEDVLATAKHFPGHGDTSEDSHYKLPIIKKSRKQLDKIELLPFKQLIEDDLEAIMSSHIAVSSLDKELVPATLSYKIMTELLRNELNFKGLIFTDALMMGGVKEEESIYVKAVLAGCDILLMPQDSIQALDDLENAVKEGKITEERIQESLDRISFYKEKYVQKNYKKSFSRINSEKNKAFAKISSEASLTKIKESISLPIDNTKQKIVNILIDQDDLPDVWNKYSCKLSKEYGVKTIVIKSDVTSEKLEELLQGISEKDLLIISFFSKIRAWKENNYPEKFVIKELEKLISKNENIVITFSNPYLLRKIKGIKDYYCTYSDSEESQKAVLEMLFKGLKPEGISPVTI